MNQTKDTQFNKHLVFTLQCLLLPVAVAGAMLFRQPEKILHALVFVAGTAVLLLVLLWWFRMHPRNENAPAAGVKLFYAGVVITTIPLVYFAIAASFGIYKFSQIALFKNMVKIVSYEEEPITWEGFEHPVGIRIKIGLEYPFYPGGWIRHPRISVPGTTVLSDEKAGADNEDKAVVASHYWQLCQASVFEGDGCFTQPIWPIEKYPELPDTGKAEIVYELYPSNINYLVSRRKVCLRERSPYAGVKVGQPVTVYWHLAYNDEIYDIGPVLQEAIIAQSEFFKSVASLEGAYASVQSNEFVIAGYQNCQIKTAIRYSEESECFCRDDPKKQPAEEKNLINNR